MQLPWQAKLGCALVFLIGVGIVGRAMLLVVTVKGRSMAPTLQEGDRVLVLRKWPARWLGKGVVIVVRPWSQDATTQQGPRKKAPVPFIKRVIGLPGDTLETFTAETNAFSKSLVSRVRDGYGHRIWHIPPDHLFVRGDNPLGSLDSMTMGPVPFDKVLGLVVMRLPRKPAIDTHYRGGSESAPIAGLELGEPALDFHAETLSGDQVSLETFFGYPVSFIFTGGLNCLPCHTTLSNYELWREGAATAGVQVLLVAVTEIEEARRLADVFHITQPVLVAPSDRNSFRKDYRILGVPSFCMIGADGRVQATGITNEISGSWHKITASWNASALGATHQGPVSQSQRNQRNTRGMEA